MRPISVRTAAQRDLNIRSFFTIPQGCFLDCITSLIRGNKVGNSKCTPMAIFINLEFKYLILWQLNYSVGGVELTK